MLSYWKNGKEIPLWAIHSSGQIGQSVIYCENVDWGKDPDPESRPLSQYTPPAIFRITSKVPGDEGYYVLTDSDGNIIRARYSGICNTSSYLYDAQEWLTWNAGRNAEKFSRKERKIEHLQGQVDLLKDILVKQGVRIVTQEQANKLGL